MMRDGRINGMAEPFVVQDTREVEEQLRATILVDAAGGLAFDACELALNLVAKRAKRHGVAFVAIRNSSHVGALGLHAQNLADRGLVGLAFSNSPAVMPFWGGRRAALGTNPVAAAFPRQEQPALVIDLALTTVARAHILKAARKGESIPLGWALDDHGQPTTDANAALNGSLLPIGGAKGSMLALAVELFCAALTGSSLSYEADAFFDRRGNAPSLGQTFLAVDPAGLLGTAGYLSRIEDLLAHICADDSVRLPGARREAERQRAEAAGIALDDDLHEQLASLGREAADPG